MLRFSFIFFGIVVTVTALLYTFTLNKCIPLIENTEKLYKVTHLQHHEC